MIAQHLLFLNTSVIIEFVTHLQWVNSMGGIRPWCFSPQETPFVVTTGIGVTCLGLGV